ncbi:MAG: hypothetical protein BWY09_01354 [Candidatus Hydrogenedentes bacterium ADurb.Bin179]|nr:MAG: hypothetical protein BWY09_01354 [Candidatus Hydrogenedentes bacterium ADurb.Bin179]
MHSPIAFRSVTARRLLPISRLISWARPLETLSRGIRVWADPGSMAYSAVTQPRFCPRIQAGVLDSKVAVQITRVSPKDTSTDPEAVFTKFRVMVTGRRASGPRPSDRLNITKACSCKRFLLRLFAVVLPFPVRFGNGIVMRVEFGIDYGIALSRNLRLFYGAVIFLD